MAASLNHVNEGSKLKSGNKFIVTVDIFTENAILVTGFVGSRKYKGALLSSQSDHLKPVVQESVFDWDFSLKNNFSHSKISYKSLTSNDTNILPTKLLSGSSYICANCKIKISTNNQKPGFKYLISEDKPNTIHKSDIVLLKQTLSYPEISLDKNLKVTTSNVSESVIASPSTANPKKPKRKKSSNYNQSSSDSKRKRLKLQKEDISNLKQCKLEEKPVKEENTSKNNKPKSDNKSKTITNHELSKSPDVMLCHENYRVMPQSLARLNNISPVESYLEIEEFINRECPKPKKIWMKMIENEDNLKINESDLQIIPEQKNNMEINDVDIQVMIGKINNFDDIDSNIHTNIGKEYNMNVIVSDSKMMIEKTDYFGVNESNIDILGRERDYLSVNEIDAKIMTGKKDSLNVNESRGQTITEKNEDLKVLDTDIQMMFEKKDNFYMMVENIDTFKVHTSDLQMTKEPEDNCEIKKSDIHNTLDKVDNFKINVSNNEILLRNEDYLKITESDDDNVIENYDDMGVNESDEKSLLIESLGGDNNFKSPINEIPNDAIVIDDHVKAVSNPVALLEPIVTDSFLESIVKDYISEFQVKISPNGLIDDGHTIIDVETIDPKSIETISQDFPLDFVLNDSHLPYMNEDSSLECKDKDVTEEPLNSESYEESSVSTLVNQSKFSHFNRSYKIKQSLHDKVILTVERGSLKSSSYSVPLINDIYSFTDDDDDIVPMTNNLVKDSSQFTVPPVEDCITTKNCRQDNSKPESVKSIKSINSKKSRSSRKVNDNKIDKQLFDQNLNSDIKETSVSSVPLVSCCENSSGTIFKLDDVVWAKITGYPYWPARIISFSVEDTIFVSCLEWYAWKEVSFIKVNNLYHFKEFYQSKYQRKKRNSKYQEAVKLAKSCCGMLDGLENTPSDDLTTLCSTKDSESDSGSNDGSGTSAS